MNKFQKIFFLFCLFFYVFSMKITNIEPKTVTLGDKVEFTLIIEVEDEDYEIFENYEDYDLANSHRFYLSNSIHESKINLYCSTSRNSSTTLNCTTYIYIDNKKDLKNLTKTLFLDNENTNLAVTIEKPNTLKLLEFYDDSYYSYGISSFGFQVNLNELYKSDFSIKFGDLSITNCSLDEEKIKYLYCYYEFPENYNGQTLKLKFGDEDTELLLMLQKNFHQ